MDINAILDQTNIDALAVNNEPDDAFAVLERVEIHQSGRFHAFAEDLGFMWRWQISRDAEIAQRGCSLSLQSSREAVGHVLAYLEMRDSAPLQQ